MSGGVFTFAFQLSELSFFTYHPALKARVSVYAVIGSAHAETTSPTVAEHSHPSMSRVHPSSAVAASLLDGGGAAVAQGAGRGEKS